MKIAHLVIGGDVAGGQIVALRLARAARGRGDEVVFLVPEHGPFVELLARDAIPFHVVSRAGALDVRSILRLARLLRRERADVLHTHVMFSGNVVGRIAARLAGVRVVSHIHVENAYRAGRGRRVQIALDNVTARLCAWIVAVSDATAATLVAQGYPRSRLVTIHNGIEPSAPAAPAGLGTGAAPVIGLVGRLCDVKGQHELIEALGRLSRDDVVAVLVGRDLETGGAFEIALREQAASLGDRVRFLGYRDDVPAVLAALDVFVLPSWVEGLPLVVLEAMLQARPVVATDVGGTAELVVDGETGILVPPRDVAALAAALDALLADPGRAQTLGEAGRRRVLEQFSADEAAARVLALYASRR